jgi:aspartyl-tRNA(Asn)/glutamyl-tRNA(Gln) amidotransferase subunit A
VRELTTTDAAELGRLLTAGEVTSVEVTRAYLERIEAEDGALGSYLHVDAEAALRTAEQVDAARAGGTATGPLAGVPLALKDVVVTEGVPTTSGSKILEGWRPPYDATLAARLKDAGTVLLGKTNMDEFGMGSSTENSGYKVSWCCVGGVLCCRGRVRRVVCADVPPSNTHCLTHHPTSTTTVTLPTKQSTRNPWDPERVPGGSSGGSAAAVAAGQAPLSLGSDTGGSIRQPAHFCGVVGVKPSYGRVSRYGLIAYASSLDVIGPLATSVTDAAAALGAMAGRDPRDASSAAEPVPDYAAALAPLDQLSSKPLAGKRFGLIAQTVGDGVAPEVNAAIAAAAKHLESLGAIVEEVSLPSFDAGLPAYYVLATAEASSNLARFDGARYGPRAGDGSEGLRGMYEATRGDGFGAEVKRRILMGTYALSAGYYDAYYLRAQKVRSLVAQEMGAALDKFDALLSPAAPTPAYRVGEKAGDPLAMYKGDLMTVNLNLAGLPAVVVPCGFAQSGGGAPALPVGLQMVGRMYGEAPLLAAAHAYEQTAGIAGAAAPAVYASPP